MNHSFPGSVPRWEVWEGVLEGPSTGNPFQEIRLEARFTLGGRAVETMGFYDGLGLFRLRFLADREGLWRFTTSSNYPAFDGLTGSLSVTPAAPGRRGPVRVSRQYHFAHEDGTPFLPFGTTCYAWTHQPYALEEQTLATLRTSPFNKMRMCVFPKSYDYNHNEPRWYPFEGEPGAWDWSRPRPEYFRHLEARIAELDRLGVECDLILFHPYDRWGFCTMAASVDDFYLR